MLGDVREEELPGLITAEEHQEASGDDSPAAGTERVQLSQCPLQLRTWTNVVLDGVAAETEAGCESDCGCIDVGWASAEGCCGNSDNTPTMVAKLWSRVLPVCLDTGNMRVSCV